MTENTNEGPQVGIARIYVKDSSFESPAAPQIFSQNASPEIRLNVGVKHQKAGDDMYEVSLNLNVEAKHGDQIMFIVEVEQAGVFVVKGFENEGRKQILEVFCPTSLFPYARQTVDQLLSSGSLPPLMLSPINFEQLYNDKNNR